MEELANKQLTESFELIMKTNQFLQQSQKQYSKVICKIMTKYDSYREFSQIMKKHSRHSNKQNIKINNLERHIQKHFEYLTRIIKDQQYPQQIQKFNDGQPFRNDRTPAVMPSNYSRNNGYQ